ncbi:MAG TPA: hypothetical protein VM802_29765 [Chitinophaga sp.]|uniref:hypothetical protein n=1 Tax=Chitinophaga sp. TaxID=1869181 RepID=UPI002CCB6AA1|nr:hypothetical protein [Chitinophaga sp.]HVI49091.1 hypothetical protein [Chitinophaga sp.]
MKKFLFLSLVITGLFYACKKDGIGTKPILSFKSYSLDSIVPTTESLTLGVHVEDGDGDIENKVGVGTIIDSHTTGGRQDTVWTMKQMASIGANKGNKVKADVLIPFGKEEIAFGNYPPLPKDSMHFVVFILDNAGNSSDTIPTPKIAYRVE